MPNKNTIAHHSNQAKDFCTDKKGNKTALHVVRNNKEDGEDYRQEQKYILWDIAFFCTTSTADEIIISLLLSNIENADKHNERQNKETNPAQETIAIEQAFAWIGNPHTGQSSKCQLKKSVLKQVKPITRTN